jgi:hypothetical protein
MYHIFCRGSLTPADNRPRCVLSPVVPRVSIWLSPLNIRLTKTCFSTGNRQPLGDVFSQHTAIPHWTHIRLTKFCSFQMHELFFLFESQILAYTNPLPSRKPRVVPGDSSRLSSGAEIFWTALNVDESQSDLRRSRSIAPTPIFLVLSL